MTQQTNAVTTTQHGAVDKRPPSGISALKTLLDGPAYKGRLADILKERAPQFAAALVQVVNGTEALKKCEPNSIIASGMTAAILDLPIEKNLGFAHIVPYKGVATFQMGYKGYIQLALRTNQYARMNACKINAEAYKGRDEVGEPIIDWEKLDETKPAAGYFFGFKTTSGYVKCVYWTKEKAMAHAQQYSQSFRSGYDSVWKTNPDAMGLKTVVKDGLSKWGIMSVQIQKALVEDEGSKANPDAPTIYPDNMDPVKVRPAIEVGGAAEALPEGDAKSDDTGDSQEQGQPEQQQQQQPAQPEKRGPGRPKGSTKPAPQQTQQQPAPQPAEEPKAESEAAAPVQESNPEGVSEDSDPNVILSAKLKSIGVPEEVFCAWAHHKYKISPTSTVDEFYEIAPGRAYSILTKFEQEKVEILAFKKP